MSIVHQYGEYVPVCDMCGDALPGEKTHQDAVQARKAAGWKSRRADGEWEDICPDCQQEEARG